MKFVLIAFLASAQAVQLNGPITSDSGVYDSVAAGWEGQQIPGRKFERPDTGLDDDTVLKKKARHHSYAQNSHAFRSKARDAYDYDPETTSPYDDMEQHMKWDFGVPRGAPGSKSPFGEHHGSWVDMSWRNQANYGVAYDESVNKYPGEKL